MFMGDLPVAHLDFEDPPIAEKVIVAERAISIIPHGSAYRSWGCKPFVTLPMTARPNNHEMHPITSGLVHFYLPCSLSGWDQRP
jgi:hypothetical protein